MLSECIAFLSYHHMYTYYSPNVTLTVFVYQITTSQTPNFDTITAVLATYIAVFNYLGRHDTSLFYVASADFLMEVLNPLVLRVARPAVPSGPPIPAHPQSL